MSFRFFQARSRDDTLCETSRYTDWLDKINDKLVVLRWEPEEDVLSVCSQVPSSTYMDTDTRARE